MITVGVDTRITLKNILFLTDFSEPSQAALPFAVAMAREFGATIHALHVLAPDAYLYGCATPETVALALEAQEEAGEAEIQLVAAQIENVPHDVAVTRGVGVWPAVEQAIADFNIDLIVLGTHGRTGIQKLLMGSVAEEIFRRSPVPVLTIGPWARQGIHNAAKFHRLLFATNFSPEAMAAAPYAISLAEEHEARLILLNVIHERVGDADRGRIQTSIAHLMYELHEIVPQDAELWCRPEAVVEYGEPAARILAAAKQRDADLIVLGVRDAAGRLGAATHLERATAHKVVAHATCPVLTVRG
ncbi:MAG: universal stress protein [Candidatus Acidiferrales bacterium]